MTRAWIVTEHDEDDAQYSGVTVAVFYREASARRFAGRHERAQRKERRKTEDQLWCSVESHHIRGAEGGK